MRKYLDHMPERAAIKRLEYEVKNIQRCLFFLFIAISIIVVIIFLMILLLEKRAL